MLCRLVRTMLCTRDGVHAGNRGRFTLFIFALQLMLTLNQPVEAGCTYEKYFKKMLKQKYATVHASVGIQSVLQCDQICLEYGDICVGANVFVSGRHHICTLFSEIYPPVTDDMLTDNRNGKFITKAKGKT